jgi:hypothetical protein
VYPAVTASQIATALDRTVVHCCSRCRIALHRIASHPSQLDDCTASPSFYSSSSLPVPTAPSSRSTVKNLKLHRILEAPSTKATYQTGIVSIRTKPELFCFALRHLCCGFSPPIHLPISVTTDCLHCNVSCTSSAASIPCVPYRLYICVVQLPYTVPPPRTDPALSTITIF